MNLTTIDDLALMSTRSRVTVLDDDLKVASIQRVGADIHLRFATVAGATYRFERTDRLAAPINWTAVSGAGQVSGTGASVEVIDPGGATSRQRFYRIKLN